MKSTTICILAALVVMGVFASEVKPVKRLTPILVVEEIEPCLNLWVDRLGFEKTMEVPEGDKLGFVGLVRDGKEIMIWGQPLIA